MNNTYEIERDSALRCWIISSKGSPVAFKIGCPDIEPVSFKDENAINYLCIPDKLIKFIKEHL